MSRNWHDNHIDGVSVEATVALFRLTNSAPLCKAAQPLFRLEPREGCCVEEASHIFFFAPEPSAGCLCPRSLYWLVAHVAARWRIGGPTTIHQRLT